MARRRDLLRIILAGGVVWGTAGCLDLGSTSDLYVRNESGARRTVSLRVVRLSDGEELVDETITVDDGGTEEYAEVVGAADCRVIVDVRDGPSGETEWADSDSNSYTLEITLGESAVDFQELAA